MPPCQSEGWVQFRVCEKFIKIKSMGGVVQNLFSPIESKIVKKKRIHKIHETVLNDMNFFSIIFIFYFSTLISVVKDARSSFEWYDFFLYHIYFRLFHPDFCCSLWFYRWKQISYSLISNYISLLFMEIWLLYLKICTSTP